MGIVVLNDFATEPGGGTAVARFCAEGLFARGRSVTFVAGDAPATGDAPGPGGCPMAGLGLEDIRKRRAVARAIDGVYAAKARERLAAVLAAHPPETTVVLLHQWTRVLSPSVFRALRGYRVLLFAHDYFLACPTGTYYHFPTSELCTLRPMGASCMLARCDRESMLHKAIRVLRQGVQNDLSRRHDGLTIVCVSEGQKQTYGGLFEQFGAVVVLENPLLSNAANLELLADEDAAPGPFLFVGRLTSEKGVRYALEACRAVGASCRVMGDGPERERLQSEFPEAQFDGWAPREAVAAAMKETTALLTPSLWAETSAMVVFEAISAGAPVVVSSRICTAEQIEQSGCGIRVEPTDASAMQSAMRTMMTPETRRPFKAAALAHARRERPEDQRRRYVAQLETLAGPRALMPARA